MSGVQVYEGSGEMKHACTHLPVLRLYCQKYDKEFFYYDNTENEDPNQPLIQLMGLNRESIQKMRDLREFLKERTNILYVYEILIFDAKKRKAIHGEAGNWEIISVCEQNANCWVFDYVPKNPLKLQSTPATVTNPFWQMWQDTLQWSGTLQRSGVVNLNGRIYSEELLKKYANAAKLPNDYYKKVTINANPDSDPSV